MNSIRYLPLVRQCGVECENNLKYLCFYISIGGASRGAGAYACDCECNMSGGSILSRRNGIFNNFSYPRSDNEIKRADFRLLTCNALRILQKIKMS